MKKVLFAQMFISIKFGKVNIFSGQKYIIDDFEMLLILRKNQSLMLK